MSLTITEARNVKTQYLFTTSVEPTINVSHFSSYVRLFRISACIFRFLHNFKAQPRKTSDLTSDEFKKAKNYWIRTVNSNTSHTEIDCLKNAKPLPAKSKISRFNPFLRDNILRLGEKLQFEKLATETKYLILLEGFHPFVKLLIHYTHIRLHHLCARIVLSKLRVLIFGSYEAVKRLKKHITIAYLARLLERSATSKLKHFYLLKDLPRAKHSIKLE
ncbi:integrase catalytic domain-containing protein [Trichonephila inaurata madagascariensis]|uniref:Integrase catalytic domain-containing protein n=1 Tax=Trichonephila inaurata madagascariensis TaxID=2747483 RepID=A0A8X6XAA8_9ARAC|nr:integrase catalytic domain-containing protein [Trichonephila inaurata madagascariensis]